MKSQKFDNDRANVQAQGNFEYSTFNMYVGAQDQDRQSTNRCLDYLAETDPRNTKTGIYQTRGGALKQSYDWILQHSEFHRWRNSNDRQVLWIKGDPGKGKTMLLCGIIDELGPTTKLVDAQANALLSFFFCQSTVPKLSNAHAVLRGLIYMLVDTQPSLLSYVRKQFKGTGEPRFGNSEAWEVLCNMFVDIAGDLSVNTIYVVVDALDECVQDQDKLLRFILKQTKGLPQVKWIISSRNHVVQRTRLDYSQSILSLELHENAESVSLAIRAYISNKIAELESLQDHDALLEYVRQTLQRKAEGTFLWVALVIEELNEVDSWKVRQVVDDVPKGLDDLYARMIVHIKRLADEDIEYCRLILSATALACRPLQLQELGVVSGLPDKITGNTKNIETMIKRSGSFLTVRDETIYFVHQSAKDYLIEKSGQSIFSFGFSAAHRRMFTQSLQVMEKILQRDIYSLGALGTSISQAQPPKPDPLAVARYSCVYWVDHLEKCRSSQDLQDTGAVDAFLRTKCLYWLEALSLLRSLTDGIISIQKLGILLQGHLEASRLQELVQDTYRFLRYHRGAIEDRPLQAYGSALVFSPAGSMIKQLFQHEWPDNIATTPAMGGDWDAHTGACLQTLEAHDHYVTSVVFSHDSSLVASGSWDKTIKIWDAHTGACMRTLEGHKTIVTSVIFSHDSSSVVSGSDDKTIKIWDTYTGSCLQTLEGHDHYVRSVVFSHDSRRVASGSDDKTIKIWDAYSGACLQTLEAHDHYVTSVVFSHDGSLVASGSWDKTIKIWDAHIGACLQTLEGHDHHVRSLVFSQDSSRVASGSYDKTVKIWDTYSGACLQTLEGHDHYVTSVVFSHDSSLVASGSWDKTIKIWDAHIGACLQTLKGHDGWVRSVVFSHDSSRVASGSKDKTIKIWDAYSGACPQTLEGHDHHVRSLVLSHDSSRVASGSGDNTIKIWDTHTGAYLQTLKGHDDYITSVVFSYDSSLVASGSDDKTIKIWDTHTGACLQTLEGRVRSVVFSHNSNCVKCGGYKFWDTHSRASLQRVGGHDSGVTSAVFSHNSSRVASGSKDKTIKIWDAHTGACLQTLEGHDDWVRSVVFSHDSSRVASGSDDKTIKMWDTHTGACLQTLEGHDDWVTSVVFSYDSSRVASGSRDKTIKMWDAYTGACLRTLGVGSIPYNLSFNATGSSLHTDIGKVALRDSPTPAPTTATEITASGMELHLVMQPSQTPEYQGYGISSDSFWITRNSQNWLWLPPMYRPECSAVGLSGLVLVLGCQSGRVLIFRFVAEDRS